jgi:hypothetical protein
MLCASQSEAANRASRSAGNWGSITWANSTACSGGGAAGAPVAGDLAVICHAVNVETSRSVGRVQIETGGTLSFTGTSVLTTDATPVITLNGGTFTAGSGTLEVTRDNATTIAAGAGTVAFNHLTMNPVVGGARVYTMSSGPTVSVGGNLSIVPTATTNNRTLTVNLVAALVVTGKTLIQPSGSATTGPTATLDTTASNFALTSGQLELTTTGNKTATFNARASTVTLDGSPATEALFINNGTFIPCPNNATTCVDAGTLARSTVVMASTSDVRLTTGTFNGCTASAYVNCFTKLQINMPNHVGTLGSAISIGTTIANYVGDLTITAGTLNDGGNQIASNGTASTLSAASGTNLVLGSASTATLFPTTFTAGNIALNVASTVTYNSNQPQAMSAIPTYGNVVLASTAAVTKTPSAAMDIDGNLTINASNTMAAGTFTHTLAGNFTNNGTYTASTGTMTFDGTSTATVAGSTATTFNNMTVNKPGATLTISTSPTVGNTLALTAGTVVTGINKISLTAAATVTPAPAAGASTAHVQGNVEKFFDNSHRSFTYPVGDGTSYMPIAVDFTASPNAPNGNLTATTSTSANVDHHDVLGGRAAIDSAKSVNRWWTLKGHPAAGNLTAGGTVTAPTTYTVTLSYRSGSPYSDALTPANVNVVRGEACFTSGATRTCNPWGSMATSGASSTQATGSGGVMVAKDLEADFVVGEAVTPRFVRQKEFIYTRELY